MTEKPYLSRDAAPEQRVRTLRVKELPAELRLATGPQLWRLNEQGALALVLPSEPIAVGSEPDPGITNEVAKGTLLRLMAERWPGLERWPRRGEAWRVEGGLVLPVPPPVERTRT